MDIQKRTEPVTPNLSQRVFLLGRAPGCDIVLQDRSVSGRHARIVIEEGAIWLEDLASRNGTFVGSPPRRVIRERINPDEVITLGAVPISSGAIRKLFDQPTLLQNDAAGVDLSAMGSITIGRHAETGALADVAIDQPTISVRHAQVSLDKGRVYVRDLGSMTGTFVDGRRVNGPTEILPGSVLQIADHQFVLSQNSRILSSFDTRGDESIETIDVGVSVSGRTLLEGVSMVVQPRELVAIMGPSGAGKSTLLSVINGNVVPSKGAVTIGGLDLHEHYELFRGRIGYVPQDDILHADLTVWQALWYAARLRLPSDSSDEEIRRRITRVIEQLGLDGTENTRIGDQRKRGVSGGQRKRVNLAMELLTDPPILVLDEPTSGLSSTDALAVVQLLRELANSGKTILMTIHQPSLEAYVRFDTVAVIARDKSTKQVGRLAWYGRAWPEAIDFFDPRDSESQPPVNVDGLLRGLGRKPIAEWVRRWEASTAKSIWVDRRINGTKSAGVLRKSLVPRATARGLQWFTLVQRTFAVKISDRWNTIVLFAQAPLIALLIAAVFSKVLRSESTLELWIKQGTNVASTMFVMALTAIWFGCSSMAREIVGEWPIYSRERMVGLSMLSYLASKATVLLGIAAVQCGLLLGIVGWLCNLEGPWVWLYGVLFCSAIAGGAIGLLLSALARTTETAAGIVPVLLLPMVVLGGSLVPLSDLPKLTVPLASVMPTRWAFEGLMISEALARPRIREIESEAVHQTSHWDTSDTDTESSGSSVESPFVQETEARTQPRSPQGISRISVATASFVNPIAVGTNAKASTPEVRDDISERTPVSATFVSGNRRFLLPARRELVEKLSEAAQEAEHKIHSFEEQTAKRSLEIEKRIAQAQNETLDRIKKESATAQAELLDKVQKQIKEANDAIELKLNEMQKTMKEEQSRIDEMLQNIGAYTQRVLVAPVEEFECGDIDMAERFFSREAWRSVPSLPMFVLCGMFVVGIVTTGAVLRFRDIIR